jgi:hypothetical protein
MPRDNNGIYTLPPNVNPVIANTEIAVAWANPTMNDLASAMTGSLARNGSSAMTGPLQLTDGTAGIPALSFTASPSTGLFRNPTGPAVETSINGTAKFSVGATEITATVPEQTAGLYGSTLTVYVDPDTGTASPSSPFSVGNAFQTIEQVNAFVNTVVGLLSEGLTVVFSSGKVYPVTANLTWNTRVNFVSSVPGTRYTFSAASRFVLTFKAQSNITDITFTNVAIFINAVATLNNCILAQPLSTDVAITVSLGGVLTTTNSTSLTISVGSLLLEQSSFMFIDNNLTLTVGTVTVGLKCTLTVGGNTTLSDGTFWVLTGSYTDLGGTLSVTLTGTGARAQLLSVDNGVLNVALATSLNTAIANKGGTRVAGIGGLLSIATGNVTITCTLQGLYSPGGYISLGGSGTTSVNTANVPIQSLGGGTVYIAPTRTCSVPGTGKNVTAVRNSYIEVQGITIAGAVYSPAVNTVGNQNSFIYQ